MALLVDGTRAAILLGVSSKPPGGIDKNTQAGDVADVLDDLKIDRAALVTHESATWSAMRLPRRIRSASRASMTHQNLPRPRHPH